MDCTSTTARIGQSRITETVSTCTLVYNTSMLSIELTSPSFQRPPSYGASSLCLKTSGTLMGVRVSPGLDARILAFRCSKVSAANWGSCLTSILYLDTSMVKTAIPSVSKNLRPRHARAPALKGRNASRNHSPRKRDGLKA